MKTLTKSPQAKDGAWENGIPKEVWEKHFPETSADKKPFTFAVGDRVSVKNMGDRSYAVVRLFRVQVGSGVGKSFENWAELRKQEGRLTKWKECQLITDRYSKPSQAEVN